MKIEWQGKEVEIKTLTLGDMARIEEMMGKPLSALTPSEGSFRQTVIGLTVVLQRAGLDVKQEDIEALPLTHPLIRNVADILGAALGRDDDDSPLPSTTPSPTSTSSAKPTDGESVTSSS